MIGMEANKEERLWYKGFHPFSPLLQRWRQLFVPVLPASPFFLALLLTGSLWNWMEGKRADVPISSFKKKSSGHLSIGFMQPFPHFFPCPLLFLLISSTRDLAITPLVCPPLACLGLFLMFCAYFLWYFHQNSISSL